MTPSVRNQPCLSLRSITIYFLSSCVSSDFCRIAELAMKVLGRLTAGAFCALPLPICTYLPSWVHQLFPLLAHGQIHFHDWSCELCRIYCLLSLNLFDISCVIASRSPIAFEGFLVPSPINFDETNHLTRACDHELVSSRYEKSNFFDCLRSLFSFVQTFLLYPPLLMFPLVVSLCPVGCSNSGLTNSLLYVLSVITRLRSMLHTFWL